MNKPTLNYSRSPIRLSRLRLFRASNWLKGLLILAVGLCLSGRPWRTSGDIRVDTGDLRYYWFGIPLEYERMEEPFRTKLAKLAAAPPAIASDWEQCVRYPVGTNNPDRMCRHFYERVAMWSDEDPTLARWILEDLVDYVRRTKTKPGLPNGVRLLWGDIVDRSMRKIEPGWQEKEAVKEYCSSHGYVPVPATAPGR